MTKFRFHWRDGKTHEGEGADAAKALTALGFSQGAVAALDYWEKIQENPTNNLGDSK